MEFKHIVALIFIVLFAFCVGVVFGFSSSVYIAVPEEVLVIMGYENNTLNILASKCNISLPPIPTQEITFKKINGSQKIHMVTNVTN